MQLDIRLPIGLMFSLLGALLVLYGLIGDAAVYERSLGLNVNLVWGIVLLVFGLFMFWLSRRSAVTRTQP
jgi:multisubunit Na+/H+ antiporter MnhG subunit